MDPIVLEMLLEEAKGWSPFEKVNWSQVASRYGLTSPNKGQIVKEFMEEQGIPSASISQTPTRALASQRRRFKEADYPSQCTVHYPCSDEIYKRKLQVIESALDRKQ